MIRTAKLFAASFALLPSACGGSSGPAVSDADRRIAAEQHPQLLAEFGGSYDGKQGAYLVRVGDKIADAAGIGGRCTFTLVNSDVVNAFAVPGCYIYVTRGLMGIVNSEGELASVLAHEVGHVVRNHSYEQQKRSLLRSLGVLAVNAITGSERLTEIAGAAAGYFTLRYSRKHEYEADDLGLGYLQKAGYDPFASADMLALLDRYHEFQQRDRGIEDAKSIPEWALTHPLTENRIARARTAAERTGIKPDALPEYEAQYLRQVDGLLYGDDPEQGFVLGRRFAHPVMRIAFEAPPDFTLTNSPQAILIEGPDGVRGEFGGGRLPPEGLDAYAEALLARLLGDAPAEVTSAQPFRASGVPGFFMQASVQTPEGAVPVSLATYAGPGEAAYHFLLFSQPGSEPQGAIGELFRSFRLLSASDVARLRPRFIRVWQVRPNDTLQSLAGRMATEQPTELLLMLNDRASAQELRPGERVKLVVSPSG